VGGFFGVLFVRGGKLMDEFDTVRHLAHLLSKEDDPLCEWCEHKCAICGEYAVAWGLLGKKPMPVCKEHLDFVRQPHYYYDYNR
jgi:hypothetical protein